LIWIIQSQMKDLKFCYRNWEKFLSSHQFIVWFIPDTHDGCECLFNWQRFRILWKALYL